MGSGTTANSICGKNMPWMFTRSITLYDRYPGIFLDMSCVNKSDVPVNVESLFVVTPPGNGVASLLWPGTSKLLTNGPMYYDPGTRYPFSAPEENTVQSWWNAGFFRGYKTEALVCGALENLKAQGKIQVRRLPGDASFCRCNLTLPKVLCCSRGRKYIPTVLLFFREKNPYSALEDYASLMGMLNMPESILL
jgi:hypothetical protein